MPRYGRSCTENCNPAREATGGGPAGGEYRLSRRRACRAVGLSRATWHRPRVEARIRDALVIEALKRLLGAAQPLGLLEVP
jgi:hypothetical protein